MNRFIKNHFSSLITDYRSLITVPSLSFILFISCLFSLILNSCNSTEPPQPPPVIEPTDTVTVSITDKTHRSITLNVKTTLNNKNWKIELFREKQTEEDTLLADFSVEAEDTTIIDDNGGNGLELETEYGYYTILSTETGEIKDTSEKVIGRTLGATSHNYVWEEYTIGESGVLYDVWGTDENNVYAVGGFRIDGEFYGIAHWDGTDWTPMSGVGGKAIFGFGEDDIWAAGGGIFYFNGTGWEDRTFMDDVLFENREYTCLWGTSSENLYFGNQGGKIVHWDGRRGRLVSVNEGKFIKDIDGVSNDFIVAVGTSLVPPSLAIYFDGLVWAGFTNVDNLYSINSVAIVNKKHIYWGGEGVFETRGNSFEKTYSSGYYIWDIDYNHETGEVYASGSFDGIYIHNGIEWKNYKEIASSDGSQYVGIFSLDNKVFFVGSNDYYAKIIIGKLN